MDVHLLNKKCRDTSYSVVSSGLEKNLRAIIFKEKDVILPCVVNFRVKFVLEPLSSY